MGLDQKKPCLLCRGSRKLEREKGGRRGKGKELEREREGKREKGRGGEKESHLLRVALGGTDILATELLLVVSVLCGGGEFLRVGQNLHSVLSASAVSVTGLVCFTWWQHHAILLLTSRKDSMAGVSQMPSTEPVGKEDQF